MSSTGVHTNRRTTTAAEPYEENREGILFIVVYR